ncbi:MAG: RluA family pseudouridine synthase [Lentisphaerae bacterium]|nr:RluA family pseudouridine synthase [Lentisphaerota bacterium]
MSVILLIANRSDAGMTLLHFIAGKLTVSNSRAKDLLDQRNIFVNRKRTWMAKHILKSGDKVEITNARNHVPTEKSVEIIYEDEYYLIINKRSGMLSNGPDSLEKTVAQQLNCPGIKAAHRLDRDTSGCLLMARDQQSFDAVVSVFRNRKIRKTYHAIVQGCMRDKNRTIATPLGGKQALTHIRVLDTNRTATHLLITIETGRTHQIRKHLHSIGHPVLGDRYYGVKTTASSKTMKIGRQMLHASGLRFKHPFTSKEIAVKAPLPKDIRGCLKMFGLT